MVKVAVIGADAVGAATALSLIERNGMCREVGLLGLSVRVLALSAETGVAG